MGATVFHARQKGKNASHAFELAQEDAYWMYGHGGYSGTIAEKQGYKEYTRPTGMHEATALKLLDELVDYGYDVDTQVTKLAKKYPKIPTHTLKDMIKVFDDKWGPAVCMEIKPHIYQFCGWASC